MNNKLKLKRQWRQGNNRFCRGASRGFGLSAAAGLQVLVAVLMLLMGGVTLSWA